MQCNFNDKSNADTDDGETTTEKAIKDFLKKNINIWRQNKHKNHVTEDEVVPNSGDTKKGIQFVFMLLCCT